MIDIFLQERGSGGEMIVRNNDIVVCYGYENMPMIAMFGGDDWFGNDLFLQGDQKFTGQTEKVLNSTPLTSAGRIEIENTMKSDLEFLESDVTGTTVAVSATIATKNKLDATINISGLTFSMNWNPDTSFLNYKLT